jgi:hypothetical protein
MQDVDFGLRLRRATVLAVLLIFAIAAISFQEDVEDTVLSRVFIEPSSPDPDEPTDNEFDNRHYADYSFVTQTVPHDIETSRLVKG